MKYLDANITHPDEAGYRIKDGVIVDEADNFRPTTRDYRRAQRFFGREWLPSEHERIIEELAWETRSGPVEVRRTA